MLSNCKPHSSQCAGQIPRPVACDRNDATNRRKTACCAGIFARTCATTCEEGNGDSFDYGPDYLGIARSDDLVIIQLTVSNTRTLDQKKALFARISANLTESPGLRPEDIFINLVEVPKENWSFGHGVAHYA